MALRDQYAQGNFDKALETVNNEKMASEPEMKLLYLMEKSNILNTKGDYYQASIGLEKAIEQARQLYTEKISKMAASSVANENFKDFYGEKFERSYLYFLNSLNYFQLYQRGSREAYTIKDGETEKALPEEVLKDNEKRLALSAARANILAWDSFLTNLKNDNFGKKVFKNDMLAKVFGGFIHEAMNSTQDDQIALQLYKDAKEALFKNYNIYSSFNAKFKDFQGSYDSFSSMSANDINSYIAATEWSAKLGSFLDEKISALAKKKKSNLKIVIQEGMIAGKEPFVVNIGLKGAVDAVDDPAAKAVIKTVGSYALTVFAADKLGLVSNKNDVSTNYLGVHVANIAANEAGIEFEVPVVKERPLERDIMIEVMNKKGEVIQSKMVTMVSPLSDIAHESVKEEAIRRYVKTGVRVAAKHLVAIVGAWQTYNLMGGNGNSFIAKTAALAGYLGASKLIAMSEQADTRYWSTISHSVHLTDLALPKGEYALKLKVKKHGTDALEKEIVLPAIKIDNEKETKLISHRLL